MPEMTPVDRLQPCLLDRLTDDRPDSTKESRDQRVISLARYRRAVLRDIEWLLNTSRHPGREGLAEFTDAARSVVDFGVPDLCGTTPSGLNPVELEEEIVQALLWFEPRILPGSLSVHVGVKPESMGHNTVSLEIRGELWAQPMPDVLYVKTDVDLETGWFGVTDRPDG